MHDHTPIKLKTNIYFVRITFLPPYALKQYFLWNLILANQIAISTGCSKVFWKFYKILDLKKNNFPILIEISMGNDKNFAKFIDTSIKSLRDPFPHLAHNGSVSFLFLISLGQV